MIVVLVVDDDDILVAFGVQVIFSLEGRMVTVLGDRHYEFAWLPKRSVERNERKRKKLTGNQELRESERKCNLEGGKLKIGARKVAASFIRAPRSRKCKSRIQVSLDTQPNHGIYFSTGLFRPLIRPCISPRGRVRVRSRNRLWLSLDKGLFDEAWCSFRR